MISVGVDIEEISRFKDKSTAFCERIFTKNELEYCFKNSFPERHLAARYCAKEAVVKALANLYFEVIPYSKIEILKNKNGSVYINILIEELKKYKYSLSISHEKNKAIAFVVVEY